MSMKKAAPNGAAFYVETRSERTSECLVRGVLTFARTAPVV